MSNKKLENKVREAWKRGVSQLSLRFLYLSVLEKGLLLTHAIQVIIA